MTVSVASGKTERRSQGESRRHGTEWVLSSPDAHSTVLSHNVEAPALSFTGSQGRTASECWSPS